jgi:hypothetical protein
MWDAQKLRRIWANSRENYIKEDGWQRDAVIQTANVEILLLCRDPERAKLALFLFPSDDSVLFLVGIILEHSFVFLTYVRLYILYWRTLSEVSLCEFATFSTCHLSGLGTEDEIIVAGRFSELLIMTTEVVRKGPLRNIEMHV